jgi:hypothetical protein
LAFTKLELRLLDQLVKDKNRLNQRRKSLAAYLTNLARLGVYSRQRSPARQHADGEAFRA